MKITLVQVVRLDRHNDGELIVNADARTDVKINYDKCEDFTF